MSTNDDLSRSPAPLAFHLIPVAVHAVNAVLVALVARGMGWSNKAAYGAGLALAADHAADWFAGHLDGGRAVDRSTGCGDRRT